MAKKITWCQAEEISANFEALSELAFVFAHIAQPGEKPVKVPLRLAPLDI